MKFLKRALKKIKCAVREVFNLLTNALCPIISAICVIAEVFQLPAKAIRGIKKAEYWLWKLCGTKEKIDEMIDKIDNTIENKDGE